MRKRWQPRSEKKWTQAAFFLCGSAAFVCRATVSTTCMRVHCSRQSPLLPDRAGRPVATSPAVDPDSSTHAPKQTPLFACARFRGSRSYPSMAQMTLDARKVRRTIGTALPHGGPSCMHLIIIGRTSTCRKSHTCALASLVVTVQ